MEVLNYEVKELDKSNVKLSITVDKESIKSSYNKLIDDLSQKVELKGFRKGRVPKSLIEKKYKDSIRYDLLNEIIKDSMDGVMKKLPDSQRPLVMSQPRLLNKEDDLIIGSDFRYDLEYDVYPKVEIKTLEGFELEVDEVEVSDEDVEMELKTLQTSESVMYEKEDGAENGDFIKIKYIAFDGDLELDKNDAFEFTLGEGQNYYDFDSQLLGLKNNEKKEFEKEYPEDFKVTSLQGKKLKFTVEIIRLRGKKLPELNDEFAKDINQKYSTLDELKKDIKFRLERNCQNINLGLKQDAFIEKLLAENEFVIPKSMLDYSLERRWMNLVQQFGGDEQTVLSVFQAQGKGKKEVLETWTESAKKELYTDLFISEFLKKEGFEVKAEELDSEIESYIEENQDIEKAKEYYSKKEVRANIEDNLRLKKILEDIFSKNTFKAKERIRISNYSKNN